MPAARTSKEMVLFSNLCSASHLNEMLLYLNKTMRVNYLHFKVSRAIQDTTINQILLLSNYSIWHYPVQTRYRKMLCKFGYGRDFQKGHIFDQVVPRAVIYGGNNNQSICPMQMQTSKTKDKWVWRKRLSRGVSTCYGLINRN